MSRYHEDPVIKLLFPGQKPSGPDLGNIEIKRVDVNYNRIYFRAKDYQQHPQYVLAYNPWDYIFALVDFEDIPPKKWGTKLSVISWDYLQNIAIFKTNDEVKLIDKIKPFLNNPKEMIYKYD